MLLKLLIVWAMIAGQVNVNIMCDDENIMPVDLCPFERCDSMKKLNFNKDNLT